MNFISHNIYWILPIILIDGTLKAIALWKSARNNQLYWFIAIAIINSIGIFPLIYIFIFQKRRKI